jgi:hypothetical protein
MSGVAMRSPFAGAKQKAVLPANRFDISDVPIAGRIAAHPF